jgi:SynChlorMet cassette radical SAM/SPASM protein ScmE
MDFELNTHADSLVRSVMRTPRIVDVEITSRCNLRCRYCYYFDNPSVNYQDLATEEWLTFFDELGYYHVMEVCLAGGEPFLRQDLPDLLNGIMRNRMRFSILSNGSLIDEKIAAFIADTGRCNYVQISVDGSCAEVHDAVRGKGSFEGAIRGIRLLQEFEIPVAVRVTLHRYNVNDIENTARFLLQDLGLPEFSTNAAGYLGSCRQNAHQLLLTTRDREIAMERLLELSRRYEGRILASAGPLAEARMWQQMVKAQQGGLPGFTNGGYLTGCGCHAEKLAVRADGVIIPCSMLAHMVLGRINAHSFIEVWQNSFILNSLRNRHLIPLTDFKFCEGCEYIPYCTGNCPALAYSLTGLVNHPSPDACLRRYLKEGGKLKI